MSRRAPTADRRPSGTAASLPPPTPRGPAPARTATAAAGRIVGGAVVAWGGALAVVVAADGSPAWRVVRLLLVAQAAGAAWATTRHADPRWRHGAAVALGVVGVAAGGVLGPRTWGVAGPSARAVAGCVLLAAALVLLVAGGVGAVRVVRGWRRLLALPAAVAAVLLVAYPVTIAVMATNVPRPGLGDVTPADRGLRYEDVTFVTDDGVTLSAWYVPSRTGAALVVRHGASSTRTTVVDQAAVLARHGYGVLLVDARGHGRSGGRAMAFGWHGDADVSAAVSYLAGRPDVDAGRIGAVGFSMGGEEAVGALATEDRLRAVVGEGVENRTFADRAWLPTGWNGWVQRGIDALAYGLTAVLADTAPPRSLRSAVAAADRPVLLVAGRGEERAAHHIAAGAPDDVTVWEAGTGHTDGLAERPDDWERTVVGFLDRHLAG